MGDDRLSSLCVVEFEDALLLGDVVGLNLEVDDGFEGPSGFDVELGPN